MNNTPKSEAERPKRPVVEVEFCDTDTYQLLAKKRDVSSQPAAANPSEAQPTDDNLNSTPLDSKNVLLTEEEEQLNPEAQQETVILGFVVAFALVIGGYYAWQWWKVPPLTK